jgi:hypothetical protein
MPRSPQTAPASSLMKTILSALVLLYAGSLFGQHAQGTTSPKYDLQTETKMNATVDEVKLPPGAKEIVHLLVKTGAETVDVYLCPKSFLDDMGVALTKGDQIVLTGSKVKHGDADLILAREVVKGTDTLVLRDAKGQPVWN